MKSGPDLQQTADSAMDLDVPCRGFGDSRQDLQECAFAGTVAADDSRDFPGLDFDVESFQGPEIFVGFVTLAAANRLKAAVAEFITLSRKVL